MEDTGFCFPIKELSSDKVKLVPFDPNQHAQPFVEACLSHPEVYRYVSIGPFTSADDFISKFLVNIVYPTRSMTTFAIIDRTQPPTAGLDGAIAGMVSYMAASDEHLVVELGFGIILPPFQRTHVSTHTVALLVRYALDPPEKGGLGLRRVVWQADAGNPKSIDAGKRLGFQQEGILRWNRIAKDAEGKGKAGNGKSVAPYMEAKDAGRDTAVLAMCWDDWMGGKRELVERLMNPRPRVRL